jgi:hypothetical protein
MHALASSCERDRVVWHVVELLFRETVIVLGTGPRRHLDRRRFTRLGRDLREQVTDGVEPGSPLVVALDAPPWRIDALGGFEHRVLGPGVLLPLRDGLDIGVGQFPPPHRILRRERNRSSCTSSEMENPAPTPCWSWSPR